MRLIKKIGLALAVIMLFSTFKTVEANMQPSSDIASVGQAVKYVGPEMPDPNFSYDAVVSRINFGGKTVNLVVTVTINPLVTQNKMFVKEGDHLNPPSTAYYYIP